MQNNRFSIDEVPAELLERGLDIDKLPTRSEIGAIGRMQSTVVPQIMTNGEIPIIDLGWIGGLSVYWALGVRGITVGMRLRIFGETHDLGSATINQDNPAITIEGPEILGYQARLTAGVDISKCELFVDARLRCGFPIYDTLGGKLSIAYGRPWPQLEPGRIVADGITPELAANIRNTPERQYPAPNPGFIQNDPVTSTVVRTMMWLVNAAGYIDAVRISAETLQAEDQTFDPNKLLLAFSISGQAGVGAGIAGATGFYITGGGEVGWFGSGGVDLGLFAGISFSIPVYVFWTGTKGFGGSSFAINISVGRSLGPKFPLGPSVTVSFYWEMSPRNHSLPAGFCFALGFGFSPTPVSAYITFGHTYIVKLGQVWKLPEGLALAT